MIGLERWGPELNLEASGVMSLRCPTDSSAESAGLMKALPGARGEAGSVRRLFWPHPLPAQCHSAWSRQLSIKQPQCKKLTFLMQYMSHPGTIKTTLLWQNVLCYVFVLWCLSVTPVLPDTPAICWFLTAITYSKSLCPTQPTWSHPFLSLPSPEQ
jgi:hypothetical protein